MGLFFFLPVVMGGAFGLLGGVLTDRFGRRRVLVWSILLYGGAAAAAGFATSLTALLFLRCVTMIGVCVEAVAGLAWLAELFPAPRQRERALAYAQGCYALGGLMVAGAYYLAVTYGGEWPAIAGRHDAWRYTLLSGLIPAIPLMVLRPFLPESPVWLERMKCGRVERPSPAALFAPGLRRTTLLTTLMMACLLAIPYGALQHTPRIVPGLAWVRTLGPQRIEQVVSEVFLVQEMGSVAGRVAFALLCVRIARRQQLLRIFLVPAAIVFPVLFFSSAASGMAWLLIGVFVAQALFNGMHSFWGNYLPLVFPTSLRGTGESFAMNIGGRMIGVGAALVTTQLATAMPGASLGAGTQLARAAGTVLVLVMGIFLGASFMLPEPKSDLLPT